MPSRLVRNSLSQRNKSQKLETLRNNNKNEYGDEAKVKAEEETQRKRIVLRKGGQTIKLQKEVRQQQQ
jgi:hypothetical protein